ncbi:hypothetical protein [Belnapia rosea]|uniref:hypothetical protein n=1 Tax=Belnapia rosea TaxID=938405 RepID=UPI00087FDC23|nr:hypothetical protein [Belnapia rosea]SDB72790.1 hypothetical protein SAMN02927895_04545 [Belnapia rosea]
MLGSRSGVVRGITGGVLLLSAAFPLAAPAVAQVAALPPPIATPGAEAQALNLTQRGIPAEASAENGVLARERALAAGRRTAWERALSEAGLPPVNLSDQRLEDMVRSIVIEQERTAPTRYTGRITVVFDPNRVRSALGGNVTVPGAAPPPVAASAPASNWVEAVAIYRSMGEWLELQRRLRGAPPVASVDIQGIAVDAARLRLGLRAPAPEAAALLAAIGIALEPAGPSWRLGLAGS